MTYDVYGRKTWEYNGIAGNGTADDTDAIQALVDGMNEVHIPAGLSIRITDTIIIDISKCRVFDGGNSCFIVDGDVPGFELVGTMTNSMTADPATLTEQIMEEEANFKFLNCRIKGTDSTQGTGIEIKGCFETFVEGCYIHDIDIGIAIMNRNRNLQINDNHIYCCNSCGVHFAESLNLHQFNMMGNMITYCAKCIWVDNPDQIANWQLDGNDIETGTYPGGDRSGFRCLLIESDDNKSGQLSEIEVCGNTIQGHTGSGCIMEISGGSLRQIKHLSVSGNHMSNSGDILISLDRVKTAAFSGNTAKGVANYAYNIVDSENIAIVGEVMDNVGGIVTVSGTATAILVVNCTAQTNKSDPIRTVGSGAQLVAKNNLINGTEPA